MPKFNHKEEILMNDLERRFYSEPETRNIPVGQLSTMKDVMQKILLDIKEEDPNVTISKLLSKSADESIKYGDASEF